MKKFWLFTALLVGGILLAGCCCQNKEARDFCFDKQWTYSWIQESDGSARWECRFPSGRSCWDDEIVKGTCDWDVDISNIDSEEKRLSGCNENALSWAEQYIEWAEDISAKWWEEDEGWASLVRNGIISYTKGSGAYSMTVECVADFVDWSLFTEFGEETLLSEISSSSIYTNDDLKSAEDFIINEWFWTMDVQVEDIKLSYMGDEKSTSELDYCKEIGWAHEIEVDECIVFESEFFIPEQDAEMAWAFEPNKTLTGYQWYLWRTLSGEWKYLTAWY
jgi:hypothetical protein